jgi:aerobic C4-dicarboxylate transport protein
VPRGRRSASSCPPAAFNLDGTSLFMSIGVMLLAHAHNVPLSWGEQLGILAIMLLTSKGAATVSGGSCVVFAATVAATGRSRSRAWR